MRVAVCRSRRRTYRSFSSVFCCCPFAVSPLSSGFIGQQYGCFARGLVSNVDAIGRDGNTIVSKILLLKNTIACFCLFVSIQDSAFVERGYQRGHEGEEHLHLACTSCVCSACASIRRRTRHNTHPIVSGLTILHHPCDPSPLRHAILRPQADGVSIKDLGSLNGSFVNEDRLEGTMVIRGGDVLQVGQTVLSIVC